MYIHVLYTLAGGCSRGYDTTVVPRIQYMSAATAGNRPREDANDDDPSPPLGACSLVIMLFGLVWIWARALVLLFDITSLQHLPQSPVNAMAGIFFCLCV